MDYPIEVLDLSVRAYNGLKRAGIDRVSQALALSDEELLAIPGIGISTLGGMKIKLERYRKALLPPTVERQPSSPLERTGPAQAAPSPGGVPINVLNLPVRAHNCLERAYIRTVSELAALSDEQLLEIRNLGRGSLAEIRQRLETYLAEHPEHCQRPPRPEPEQPPSRTTRPIPSPAIGVLQLSARARNGLYQAGIDTVAQLLALSDKEILEIRNIGVSSLSEIKSNLEGFLGRHPEYRVLATSAEAEASQPILPPVIDAGLRTRTARIPLADISIERLVLPRREVNRLSNFGVSSIGHLIEQPATMFAPDSRVPTHLNQYLHWLVTQEEGNWTEEVAGKRVSPMHRLLLSDTTLDQLVTKWLKGIDNRSQEVLRLRLGQEGPPLTLEETGQRIGGVTRERARQIEGKALKRLRNTRALQPIESLALLLKQEFMDAGGLLAEDEICERLVEMVEVEEIDTTWAARLLLHSGEEFEGPQEHLWVLAGKPLDLVPSTNAKLVELLGDAGRPVTVQQLLVRFAATAFGQEHEDRLDEGFAKGILRVSRELEVIGEMAQLRPRTKRSSPQSAKTQALPTTLSGWESRLRPQVAQVELLGEIPVTAEGCTQLGKAIGSRLKKMGVSEVTRLFRQNYPCSLAVFLVAQGVYGYGGIRGYWPSVGQAIDKRVDANLQGQLGRLFETILAEKGLPLFPDLGGRRYLDLILLHGGIPDYSLADFFANMLQPGVTRDRFAGMSATELIDEWIGHSSGRYVTDKPVLRFLEFGGAVAQDFCERCLEMARETADSGLVPEAGELGLPRRVVDAYRAWVAEQDFSQVRRDSGGRWQLHKPEMVVDPWGEGVLLDLPPQQVPATEIESDITWRITVGEQVHTIPLHVRRTGFDLKTPTETFALNEPAAEYEVTLLANGEDKRTWRYQGLDEEECLLLAFDPERGSVLPWKHSLPARCLGLLYPRRWDLRIGGQGSLLEDLPRLPWGWSDFRCQTWELSNAQSLRLSSGETTLEIAVRLDEMVQRPYLMGGQILSTGESRDGAPVYVGAPPVVRIPLAGRQDLEEELARWRVTVRNKWAARPEVELTETLADLYADLRVGVKDVDLVLQRSSLLGTEPFGNFEIRLRGPLGRDARFALRLVPQLRILGHEELHLPDVQIGPPAVTLRVETLPGYGVECQGMGEDYCLTKVERGADLWVTQIRAEPHVTAAELTVIHHLPSGEAIRVPVTVPIRRLRWALVEEQGDSGRREWAGQALRRAVDALLRARSAYLLVDLPRTEADEASLRLRLLDMDGEELQRTDWSTLPAGQRLWRFELGAFFDTVRRASLSPFLRFELEAYGLLGQEALLRWPVLSLTRHLLVENVHLKVERAGSRPVFDLRWDEPTPLKNRHVRFWPLWRPWDAVFEQAIPDSVEGAFTFNVPLDRVQSGKYRLEFLVVDPWVPQVLRKPAKDTPGTVDVELISPGRQLKLLEARIQKRGECFEFLLERAVLRHDMGNPEEAKPDLQWCYEHLDDGTVSQVLALVELVKAVGEAALLRALQLKMFAASRLERIFQARQQGSVSREEFDAYLDNLPRSGLLPQATCGQLLSVENETVRLHALQQLIRRGATDGLETVLNWVETARLSDADAIAILSLNAGFAVELLREQTDRPAARRLLSALSQTVEDVVRVGSWLRSNLGWGRVEAIEHLDTGGPVQWCIGGKSRYRLYVALRPDVQPEMITVDLASSTADFVESGPICTCAECGQFTTQNIDLMAEHYLVAHRPQGYWERRYRRDKYARFRPEDRPISLSSLEFVTEKPGKQLV